MMEIVTFLLVTSLSAAGGRAQAQAQEGIDEQIAAAFAWLDAWDPLDTSALPYVCLLTGKWEQRNGDPPSGFERATFLLSDDGTTIVVRGVDLEARKLRRRASSERHERVDWESADIAADARALAMQFETHRSRMVRNPEPGRTVQPRAEALLLARACARRGLDREAVRLVKAVAGPRRRESPLAILKAELSLGCWWQILAALSDADTSRSEILARCQRYREFFPERGDLRAVQTFEDGLVSLIAEERRRGGHSEVLAGSDAAEAIARDVYALRDQCSRSYIFPVGRDYGWLVLDDDEPDRPSERLIAAGFEAVPRLIEAIADERPSRCIRHSSRRGGSIDVESIGSQAQAVLEAILGQEFHVTDKEIKACGGDATEALQQSIRACWEPIRARGESALLREWILEGGERSLAAAGRLIAKDPARAFDAIVRGARAADDPYVRRSLVTAAVRASGDELLPFLLGELRANPSSGARVVAARELHRRGRPEALEEMIRAWKAECARRSLPLFDRDDSRSPANCVISLFDLDSGNDTVAFLVSTGRASAMHAVVEAPPPPSPFGLPTLLDALCSFPSERSPGQSAADWDEAERLLEDLLVRGLDDQHRVDGVAGLLRGLRHEDLYAHALARRWPERYAFDQRAPEGVRDRQIAAIQLTWELARGEAVEAVMQRERAAPK